MLKKAAVALMLCCLPSLAQADGLVSAAKVTMLSLDGSAVRVYTDGTKSNNPACSAAPPGPQFAVPLTNQNAIAMLMTAKASGSLVTIGGSGACTYQSGVENINCLQY